MLKKNKIFFFFGYVLLMNGLCAQSNSFEQLEHKVYQLNNEQKYNESQKLLLPILQDESLSNEYKYQAAILLSYTYKRVFDYESALKFLDKARQFAEKTSRKGEFIATVRAEEAFVYFDTHAYAKSDSLMSLLAQSDFRHISLENKSKLVMQQGYLRYMDKDYARAESIYDQAIRLMRASAPCHLPMILVKKMELYSAMNQMNQMRDALRQSTYYADSCGIIKYQLYAFEQLLDIYKKRNDLPQIALTQLRLDSLNLIYLREKRIASLHNQKEHMVLAEKDKEIRQEKRVIRYMTLALVSLALVALILGGLSRRKKKRALAESPPTQPDAPPTDAPAAPPHPRLLDDKRLSSLSERQREVLYCMAEGMSNKEIADKLFISENTVKFHVKNIYQLLDIKDRKDFLVQFKK